MFTVTTVRQLGIAVLQSPALRQSAALASSNAVSGVLFGLALIIASRTLGPEKFGIFSVSIAVMNILARGVDLGLNQVMPRLLNLWVEEKEKVRAFLGQVVQWKIGLAFLTMLLGLLALPILEMVLKYPYPNMLIWAIVGALLFGMYEYVFLVETAGHAFWLAAGQGLLHAGVKFIGFLLLFLSGWVSVDAFSAVYYIAPAIAAFSSAYFFRGTLWVRPKRATKEIRRTVFRYLGHSAIGIITFTLYQNVDVLFVHGSLSSLDTGLYAGATRLAMFVGLVSISVMSVLNNRVSRYRKRATLVSYLKKSSFFVVLSAIGFLLFLPLARTLLVYTIGPQYLAGLVPMIVLILNAFLTLAVTPYVSFFFSVDHPRYFSVGGMLQVGILVAGNALLLNRYGVVSAAWVKVITTAVFSLYTIIYILYALRQLEKKELVQYGP